MKKPNKKVAKRKTKKERIISYILDIIEEHGSFNFADVPYEMPVCINSMGVLVAQAETFSEDDVEVNVYRPIGFSSDPIDTYYLEYKDLTVAQLEGIAALAESFDVESYKTIKRTLN